MQSYHFGAEEVVAGGDVGGDLHVHAAAAEVHVFCSPEVCGAVASRALSEIVSYQFIFPRLSSPRKGELAAREKHTGAHESS